MDYRNFCDEIFTLHIYVHKYVNSVCYTYFYCLPKYLGKM